MKYVILFLLTIFCFSHDAWAGDTFDRVTKAGAIRCGYGLWAPVLYKEPNTGEVKGIVHDLMDEVGKRLDLKVEWTEETGWGTLIEGMVTNRYDMICTGLFHSTARAKFIGFGTPIFYSPLYAIVKKDDVRFDKDISLLNDPSHKLAVLEGEMSSIAARQVFPKAATDAMPQTQDYAMLLKEIETGKADAALMSPETFLAYDATNPGKLKMLDKMAINVFPTSVGLPKDDMAFNSMINTAIEELVNDGTVERLIKKYEPYPGVFMRVAKPYLPPK